MVDSRVFLKTSAVRKCVLRGAARSVWWGTQGTMELPAIRGSHTFYCAFCIDECKSILCQRHSHIWNDMCESTKAQAINKINEYNSIIFPNELDRKKLQLFVNRLVVTDELNKLKNAKVDAVYMQALEQQNRFYFKYSNAITVLFMSYAFFTEGVAGFWKYAPLTFASLLASS